MQVTTASTPDPVPHDAKEAVSSVEILDECFVADICIDRYLWALTNGRPKWTIKVHERRKVTVKKKGKTVTVTKCFTKLVNEDFTWKDPKASYHGGSFRGGYGHGLAADVVSVKGATRAQRWISTESLWKWIDEHGKEFGIGRPYLDKDPLHTDRWQRICRAPPRDESSHGDRI